MNVVLLMVEVIVLLTISFLIGGIKASNRQKTAKRIVSKLFAVFSAVVLAHFMWEYCYDGMLRAFLRHLSDEESGAWAEIMTLVAIAVASVCYYSVAVKMTAIGAMVIAEWRIVWQNKRNDNRYICRSCGSMFVDGQEILCISAADIAWIIVMDQARRERSMQTTVPFWKIWLKNQRKREQFKKWTKRSA